MLIFLLLLVVAIAVCLSIPALRRPVVSAPIMRWFKSVLPPMSAAETAAISSGTTGFEAELFSGRPNYTTIAQMKAHALTAEEQAFLDNELATLCAMLDDWEVEQKMDLAPEIWAYMKAQRFFGLIIPHHYGGRGFSNAAHAAVVTRLATRSNTAAVTVMVPNSLGPAELLLHYGTDEQKDHYLPRLASGEEIPCFALTNPHAGSDAGSIPDLGVVVNGTWNGEPALGFCVTWSKRYITLGPVATVLGLAFRAVDPDGLLGKDATLGITCALIPTTHSGVNIGRRHAPMHAAFMNGPNSGKDVFIPLDWVIGGRAQIGHGWTMLMECLAAGRAISLPSVGIASQMLTVRSVGAYAGIRHQFGLPIAKFHGVAKPLGQMAARLYAQDGARRITYDEMDRGEKPAVASAILKYHLTEGGRQSVSDGMDILGGKGISMGPRNFLASAYASLPIAITVEGANILTRSLIIFGQGAFRCHPFIQEEMASAAANDLEAFDRVLFAHIGHTLGNLARGFGVAPQAEPPSHDERLTDLWTDLNQLSARFALSADLALLFLGGNLKRLELQSARLGDVLSELYFAAGALVRWNHEGRRDSDLDLARLAAQSALHRGYVALDEFFHNAPTALRAMRFIAIPTGIATASPRDTQWLEAAELITHASGTRQRLTAGVYVSEDTKASEPLAQLDRVLVLNVELHTLDRAMRGLEPHDETGKAVLLGASDEHIALMWRERERLLEDLIGVDDFSKDAFGRTGTHPAEGPSVGQTNSAPDAPARSSTRDFSRPVKMPALL